MEPDPAEARMRCGRLIDSNACPPCLKRASRIVVYGRCLEQIAPSALEEVLEDAAGFSVCLEAEHANMIGFKLAGMLARCGGGREVVVFTVDGSMHCTQLHYTVEEVWKLLGSSFPRRHLVWEGGRVVEVPPEAVKASRYLSRVARLLRRCGGSATPGSGPHS